MSCDEEAWALDGRGVLKSGESVIGAVSGSNFATAQCHLGDLLVGSRASGSCISGGSVPRYGGQLEQRLWFGEARTAVDLPGGPGSPAP